MMKKIFGLIICLVALATAPAFAVSYKKARDAYKKGDYEDAFREWRLLAEQGDAFSEYTLGELYANGSGVPQDYREAVKWWKLAAEELPLARHNLGVMYNNGWGIPQDYVLAHMWFNIAASLVPSDILEEWAEARSDIAKLMTPEQIAEAQKLARECVAKNYKGC